MGDRRRAAAIDHRGRPRGRAPSLAAATLVVMFGNPALDPTARAESSASRGAPSAPCHFCPGDMNQDAAVNIADAPAFVDALLLDAAGPCSDLNGDGRIDGDDIQAFVDRAVGAAGTCPPRDYYQACFDTIPPINHLNFEQTPIPAGFFGPGSDPFTDVIEFTGDPIDDDRFGYTDVLIRRSADPFAPEAPIGSVNTVPIELIGLNLVSLSPITVTYGGVNPQDWNVHIGLPAALPQAAGSLTASKTFANGGTFSAVLPMRPVLTFTRVDQPTDIRTLGPDDAWTWTFTYNNGHFVHDLGPTLNVLRDVDATFIPGIRESSPGSPLSQAPQAVTGASPRGELSICPALPRPINDACTDAITIGEGDLVFSTIGATRDGPDEPGLCNFSGSTIVDSDVWFRYAPSCTGVVTISLCDSVYDTKIAIYGSTCPSGSAAIACNDDICGLQSRLTFSAAGGADFLIRVGGFEGSAGNGILSISIECSNASAWPDPSDWQVRSVR